MSVRSERLAFEMAERGALLAPNPLVARDQPVFTAEGPLVAAPKRRRLGFVAEVRPEREPWLEVHAGVGPVRLLVSWAASSGPCPAWTPPTSYRIESAVGSARGVDGGYRLELRVTDNAAAARAHVIEFDGQSWVRMTLEGSRDGRPVGIDRLALHDASDGTDDVWLILGDELARAGFTAEDAEAGFSELVHERYPGYFPACIDESRGGERPAQTLARLADVLAAHPHARHVALAYGIGTTGDRDDSDAAALVELTARLVACDRSVLIARSPRSPASAAARNFNRAIEELEAHHDLLPAPDLESWFAAHPEQMEDAGYPNLEGRRALRRLWVEALDVLYVPQ